MPTERLTDAGISKRRLPDKGRMEIHDAVVQNLSIRITAKGSYTWCYVYRVAKTQRRMTIGHYPDISILQARQIAKKAREDIAFGQDPITLKEETLLKQIKKEEEGITLQALWDDYNVRYVQVRHKRARGTVQTFEKHILPYFGKLPARTIQRKDVIRRIDEIKASGRAHAANHMLASMRKMFNWAIQRDELQFNPCYGIPKPIKPNERERVLSKNEIRALWHSCTEAGYPYGSLVKMLLLTGQRLNEIARLKWTDIDLEERVIHLKAEDVKNGHGHDVPLSEMAIQLLNSLPRFRGPYVFSCSHGAKPVNGFSKTKKRLDEDSKVTGWRLHDLRRTCGTRMAEIGVPPMTISRILNHSEGGITKIYVRFSFLKEKREALNLWSADLAAILNEPDKGGHNVIRLERAG